MNHLLSLVLLLISSSLCLAQTYRPDLQNASLWNVFGRKVTPIHDGDKKAIRFNEQPNDGGMVLKNYEFTDGVIEFDVRGKNILQQSFVGIGFHLQDNKANSKVEIIYFRPFNFMNPDTVRRPRSVQYVCLPDYEWDKLREKHPGKYENKVNPVPDPDDWFHAKVTVNGKQIKVYVNHSAKPSLEVESLGTVTKGQIGLWVGYTSGGDFANLEITPARKKVTYGNNPEAGKYINTGDAAIYYEVYGKGKPFVLLHGGVYGYIDEFEPFIDKLTEKYQVICVGTRGHGKSEIGKESFTWKQRAEDAYKVIRAVTKDSVAVLGFSDGGYTGFKLAAAHPELVKRLIVIGAGDRARIEDSEKAVYTPELLLGQAREYFEGRLAIMPEPGRWGESLTKMNKLYNEDLLSKETFEKIKCPTLLMSGDRDGYLTAERMLVPYRAIKTAQLSIIPGCDHVVFYCNFPAVWAAIEPVLN